jgi:hypothetical protein
MATTLKTKNSVVTTVVPTTLAQGELAVNITDKKMWVGNAATTPVQILGAGVTNDAGGSTTQVQYNSSGVLAGSANMTFSGTALTLANDASISGLTVGKGGGAVVSNTVLGLSAGTSNTTGAYNTFVGGQDAVLGRAAGQLNTTGSINTALGNGSLASNLTGGNNTAVGYRSLSSSTASNNTALGAYALLANTTGDANVAIGRDSLQSNTTASNNTAVGYQAGYSNTVATHNTFIGWQAGYSYNGSGGTYNTFIGTQAGTNQTSGQYNTYVGLQAGYLMTTGARNTILGAYSGNGGGLDIRTGSNYIVLSDGDGNPNASCSDSLWSLGMGTKNNDGLVAFQALSGANFGPVLIGRTGALNSTTSRWYVGSNSWIKGGTAYDTLTCAAGAAASGGVALSSGATSWASASDARLKNVTGTYTNALADIAQIEPVKFTWKSDTENKPQVGVIAQSVIGVVPEAVDSDVRASKEDETEYMSVRYTELIPLMIASIQELKAEIDQLKAK